MNLGDSFIIRAPAEERHLHIVIYCQDGTLVLVNLTERKPPCDDSCIVRPGDHPFVVKESIAFYRMMKVWDPVRAYYLEQQGIQKPYEPVSAQLLERLQRGALASPYSSEKAQALIRRFLPK